jgi:hypothetical protein
MVRVANPEWKWAKVLGKPGQKKRVRVLTAAESRAAQLKHEKAADPGHYRKHYTPGGGGPVKPGNPFYKKNPRRKRRKNAQQLPITFERVAAKHLRGSGKKKKGAKPSRWTSTQKTRRPIKSTPLAPSKVAWPSVPIKMTAAETKHLADLRRQLDLFGPDVTARKKRKKKSSTKRKAARRTTRMAARRGGTTMAKKRKRTKRHCRKVPGYTIKRGKRAGKRVRAYCRKNPSIPEMVKVGIGVGVGAGSGVALSYAADRLNIGSASQRNWGLIAAGVLAGIVVSMKSAAAGASIGGGIASIGLSRALVTTLYANPTTTPSSIKGLGMGNGGGSDFDGAYDQVGGQSVYDSIGAVVDGDMGYVNQD